MLHHRDQHRRHAQQRGAPLGLAQLEHQRGVEREDGDVHRPRLRGAERAHRAARGVEHRHRVHVDVARSETDPAGVEARVVRQPAVGQQRALREAGGSRRVLDLDDVVRVDVGQRRGRIAGREELVPLLEQHDLPERGQVGPDLGQVVGHRAPELADQEDPGGPGLVEHVAQLLRPVGRVDRDQRQPGQRGAELQDLPLRQVRCPHGDPLAGGEPAGQRAGGALGVVEQLGERPASPARRVGQPADQREPVRVPRRRLPQDSAYRGLPHRVVVGARPVRLGQVHRELLGRTTASADGAASGPASVGRDACGVMTTIDEPTGAARRSARRVTGDAGHDLRS